CYAETPAAPVAPYAPDDCATGECEFSRISEGYRFELRCDPIDPPETVIQAIAKCRKTESLKDSAGATGALISLIDRHQASRQTLRTGTEPLVAPPPAAEFRKI